MDDQIEQAVEIALRGDVDASLKQQAMDFCNQVKTSPDGWQVCLEIINSPKPRSEYTRYFALQTIDYRLPSLNAQQVLFVRETYFAYLTKCVDASTETLEPAYIRNKYAETLTYLFCLCYCDTWRSFFTDLLALTRSGTPHGNAKAVDLYLRTLNMIHQEIGDNLIIRDSSLTKRNTLIKDLIRQNDMTTLANSWREIISEYGSTPASRIGQSLQNDILENVLKVIGGWISWMEISLVVEPTNLRLIFSLLELPSQRLNACDTLIEIVSKKMKPENKLELITLLNLTQVISQIPAASQDLDLIERIAKLCNAVAVELVGILDGSAVDSQPRVVSENLLNDLIPYILSFLAHEYDDVSMEVFPAISDYLGFIKKEVKRLKSLVDTSKLTKNSRGVYLDFPPDETFVSASRNQVLAKLLETIIMKMKYDEDSNGDDDDDDEGEFMEMRARLKIFQDSIASINSSLYIQGMKTIIERAYTASSLPNADWRDVELGLYELSAFGESLRNGSIVNPKGSETPAGNEFSQLFFEMISSSVLSVNHPLIQLLFMEIVVKHYNLLTQQPTLVERVLELFVSNFGTHSTHPKVQIRSWFLFLKLVKSVKGIVGPFAELLVTSLLDLLVVKAEVPPSAGKDDNDSDKDERSAVFDSQLYLFEAVGILTLQSPPSITASLLEKVLNPLYSDVQKCLAAVSAGSTDTQLVYQVHHDIMAIGTYARGFETESSTPASSSAGSAKSNGSNSTSGASSSNKAVSKPSEAKKLDENVLQAFGSASEVILVALESLGRFYQVRDAARFSISRLLHLLGKSILPELPRLIQSLLNDDCTATEISDFLSFLGQLAHEFRTEPMVYEMLCSLITPLSGRIFYILDAADVAEEYTNSTDASLERNALRRSFLSFLFNLFNNGLGSVLVRGENITGFRTLVGKLMDFAVETTDTQAEKMAFTILGRIVAAWGSGRVDDADTFGKGLPVEGIEQFALENLTKMSWESLTKPGFDVQDAQCRIMISEIAGLEKIVYEVKGPVFLQYLMEVYFPQIQLPQQQQSQYVEAIQKLDAKDFRKFFVKLVQELTGR